MRHIGIAVITTGHRELPEYPRIEGADFIVFEDHQLRGPAWARNQCLRLLEGCEHIFLFDDDFTFRPLEVLRASGEFAAWKLDYAEAYLGRVTYQSAAAVRRIGGYDEGHGRYGLERQGRCARAERAGLRGDRGIADPTLSACIVPLVGRPAILTDEEKEAHIPDAARIYKRETTGDWFRAYQPTA